MHLGYVIFYVSDVAKTVSFYERAFGLKRRFVHESGTYAEMKTGATALAFVDQSLINFSFQSASKDGPPFGQEIGLVTVDVEAAYTHALSAGALSQQEPKQKPWGQTVAYVRDLNGFLVELCSPMPS